MPSSRPASPERGPALELFSRERGVPWLMGIVNATPDSFYAGSRKPTREAALAHGLSLCEEGADVLDVGGQSTRPGSEPVPVEEELRRVLPLVEALARRVAVPISVDTDKAEVARRCREAGARVLNDVTALRGDPAMPQAAAAYDAVVLMHMRGTSPRTMQDEPRYGDVVAEVRAFLAERREAFRRAGGDPGRVLFDPGIGFGKDLSHNLSLLKHLDTLAAEAPLVVGASRKSFLGMITADGGPEERLEGSLAAACWAALAGVRVLRVHDVLATRKALKVLEAIRDAR